MSWVKATLKRYRPRRNSNGLGLTDEETEARNVGQLL